MRVAMDNHKKKRKRRKQEGIGGNGAFFACCGALAGLLSMIKRIPLTNIIGDNGNAYFSMLKGTVPEYPPGMECINGPYPGRRPVMYPFNAVSF